MASSDRPAKMVWLQLLLRTIALLLSLTAIVIAIYVAVDIHRVWYMVLVSSLVVSTISTAEICALTSLNSTAFPVPRFHPLLLIWLDLIAVGVLVWSFFWLFLDDWNKIGDIDRVHDSSKPRKVYDGEPWNGIEMWATVGTGAVQLILMVFDYVDCCHRRRASQRDREARLLRPVRSDDATSVE